MLVRGVSGIGGDQHRIAVRRRARRSQRADIAAAPAARIDQHLEPLNTTLKNGQTVEIITANHARPNAAWLNFVKTAKARHRIRNYLKNQREDEAVRLGRRLLEKSMRELKVPLSALKGEIAAAVLKVYGLSELEPLYLSIGLGQRLAPLVAVARMTFAPPSFRSSAAGSWAWLSM